MKKKERCLLTEPQVVQSLQGVSAAEFRDQGGSRWDWGCGLPGLGVGYDSAAYLRIPADQIQSLLS